MEFLDLAPETGTAAPGFGRGAAMVDVDGDGLLDIVAANDSMPNSFFRQRADHTFEDAASLWGIAHDESVSWGVLVTDFDNDGDPDVYFLSGGFPGQPNQLLRNDIATSGVLTDVTAQSGDAVSPQRAFGGTALDYDLDGDLDIFLTSPNPGEANVLLRNDGGLFFTDVSTAAGIAQEGTFRHCSAGDFDNDGWLDVAVGAFVGPNKLYRNNGDGTFTDVAAAAGVEAPHDNFGLVLEDFDNDGWQDLFVPKYLLEPTGTSLLYRNNHDGTFSDVTAGSGMTGQTDMGHNTGDLDADGYPDIFIGTGNPAFPDDIRLFLVNPDGEGGFSGLDVSDESGVTANGPVRCHGIALGDYDQDGYVDVYNNNGGPAGLPETSEPNFLWHSQGNGHGWTALRLTGVISNRSGVGARSVAFTSAGREIHRMLRAGNGFASTDSPIQHFGIGPDESIDRIEILWPSGVVQTIVEPPLYQVIDVVETADGDPLFADGFESGDASAWSLTVP
ncbi:MAG: CRTAC1 family protein [Acidobacteriota bacterium]|nr:CRTAC1 family protein [Acidobacteriota bacterium]MDH3523895.1 CRTAC1 family protein [Acidobacteriota bacterium]